MGQSVYKDLPSHPDEIYPDWDINDRSRESFETSDGTQLVDCYGGQGPMTYWHHNNGIPANASAFIEAQFQRFGLPIPEDDLLRYCWHMTYYYVDTVDPYIFFHGCTDVIKTEENYFHQYSVTDDKRKDWTEIEPGESETFRMWDKGEEAWNILMQHPGLDEYFDYFADYFSEHFEFVIEDDHPESYAEEWEFIRRYGKKQAYDLSHLGLWASIMWMMSPMAKSWRAQHHPIFEMCYEYGECLIHGWCFHSPDYYRKEGRPAMTCSSCGTSEWCVELVQTSDNDTKFMCESCLNPIKRHGSVCGGKTCAKYSCPHHPGQKNSRLLEADARYGELKALPNGHKARDLPGIMYINEKAIEHYSVGIANALGEDLKKLLTF